MINDILGIDLSGLIDKITNLIVFYTMISVVVPALKHVSGALGWLAADLIYRARQPQQVQQHPAQMAVWGR